MSLSFVLKQLKLRMICCYSNLRSILHLHILVIFTENSFLNFFSQIIKGLCFYNTNKKVYFVDLVQCID